MAAERRGVNGSEVLVAVMLAGFLGGVAVVWAFRDRIEAWAQRRHGVR
jgi:hypothetical protein